MNFAAMKMSNLCNGRPNFTINDNIKMDFGEKFYIIKKWIKSTDKHFVSNISPSGSNVYTVTFTHLPQDPRCRNQ